MANYLPKYQRLARSDWRFGERVQGSDGGCAARMSSYFLIALALLSIPSRALMAFPETWFNPIVTETGSAGSEFGSALACSAQAPSFSASLIAVGAPQANSGEGRVHIYGPSGLIQTLVPPLDGGSGNFGYAVRFVRDLNGDSFEELAIGEPDLNGTLTGRIHLYLSNVGWGNPYAHCGTQVGGATFGSFIVETDQDLVYPRLVVTTRDGSRLDAFDVTQSGGVCTFTPTSDYQGGGLGGVTSRYGQSVGYMDSYVGANRLIVGAPRDSVNSGVVYLREAAGPVSALFSGPAMVPDEKYGVAIATSSGSRIMGFLGPGDASNETVRIVRQQDNGSFGPWCTASIPMSDLVDSAGQALVHLQSSFASFVGIASQAVFGSYRSEASTGGSVALIGATSPSCSEPKQINNCALDANQRQGQALAGGGTCVDGFGRKLLIVGAPGYSNNAGRIDVYAEGTHLGSVAPCGAPTNTPTATPTSTPTPTATPTAMSQATATAEPTLTAAPGFEGTPIPVDQRTQGLPAPQVSVAGTGVSVVAPVLVSSSKLLKLVGYLFEIRSSNSRASLSAMKVGALGKASQRRQLLSKRNRISLRGLKPGTYTVTYRAVFSANKKKRVLGQLSRATIFTVR